MRRAILGLLLLTVIGCSDDLPGKPLPPRELKDDEKAARLFATNCSGCHGKDGNLGPAPPINDPLFLALIPDEEFKKVLREGRPGTPMPSFLVSQSGTLTEEDVDLLTVELKKRWSRSRIKGEGAPTYLASGKGDAAAGKQVWTLACAGCHGDNGRGGSAGAINDPAFLALLSDQAIRRIIITGRPDLGMPNYADGKGRAKEFKPLTEADVANLTAFVAEWRQTVGGN